MKFIALGAADSVGASCYFLQMDGLNFLLDCGKGVLKNSGTSGRSRTFGPDFTPLIPEELTSLSQLDAIFLSHGHYDHIGYLPDIIRQCPDTPVYATRLTQRLGWYLMMDRYYFPGSATMEQKVAIETRTRAALDRIQPVNYMQSFRAGPVRVTFYEAGHVPGAAMILLESETEGSVLYTGDFCRTSSKLTQGYMLPAGLRPDWLVMCGLHARHPAYLVPDGLNGLLPEARDAICRGRPCLIPTRELTKGIEIIDFLAEQMDTGRLPDAPLFMDDRIWTLSERLRESGIPVLHPQCRRFPQFPLRSPLTPGLYVGGRGYFRSFPQSIQTNFSLHADYAQCAELLGALCPETVILVHSPRDTAWGHFGDTALERDFPETAFLYPTVGQKYILS